MNNLEAQLKQTAQYHGAAATGIANRERLLQSPPSANPDYLLPSAQSAISFAVATDRHILRQSFRRETWLELGEDLKHVQQRLYAIGDRLVELLAENGFDAVAVDGNDTYRTQKGVTDPLRMTEFVPDFSHRYGAVAAGIGRLGWSGNLLTKEHGATVILGTVLTSAILEPDPLMQDNPCDSCKLCTSVCPIEMISPRASVEVVVAGIREVIGKKQPDARCWVSCGGFQGLHKSGRWSNLSPYRVVKPIPDDREDLASLLIELRERDPEEQQDINPFTDYRRTTFDPNWRFVAACGNCANVCWERREDRVENRRLLVASGQVVLRSDGLREPASGEIVEVDTPFGVKVAVLKDEYEQGMFARRSPEDERGYTFMDREVLRHLAATSPQP